MEEEERSERKDSKGWFFLNLLRFVFWWKTESCCLLYELTGTFPAYIICRWRWARRGERGVGRVSELPMSERVSASHSIGLFRRTLSPSSILLDQYSKYIRLVLLLQYSTVCTAITLPTTRYYEYSGIFLRHALWHVAKSQAREKKKHG